MGVVNGVKSGMLIGSPDANELDRFPDINELIEICKNPKVRAGIDRIEKHDFGGRPSALKVIINNMCKENYEIDRMMRRNKKIIDKGIQKLKKGNNNV